MANYTIYSQKGLCPLDHRQYLSPVDVCYSSAKVGLTKEFLLNFLGLTKVFHKWIEWAA